MRQLRISLPNDRYRRMTGLLLGALVGPAFGLVSQLGDRFALPGVPLYKPPFGPAGNIVMVTLAAAFLGLLVAWPMGGIKGTFLVAAGSAGAIITASLLDARDLSGKWLTQTVAGAALMLPFWAMLVPVLGALRWVIDRLEEDQRDRRPLWRRAPGTLALLLVVGLVGLTTLYPARGRDLPRQMHATLVAAQTTGDIPPALEPVDQFYAHLDDSFQLSWEGQSIERFRIPRPGRNFDLHSAVIARYASGWSLVCVYIMAEEPPLCRGLDVLPR